MGAHRQLDRFAEVQAACWSTPPTSTAAGCRRRSSVKLGLPAGSTTITEPIVLATKGNVCAMADAPERLLLSCAAPDAVAGRLRCADPGARGGRSLPGARV